MKAFAASVVHQCGPWSNRKTLNVNGFWLPNFQKVLLAFPSPKEEEKCMESKIRIWLKLLFRTF